MKILYVAADQTLSGFHGGTVHVFSVVKELVKHGHTVHVALQPPRWTSVESNAWIKFHAIKKRPRYLLWRTGGEIQRLLNDLRPDVVLERYYNFSGEAVIRAHKMQIPTVLEVNSPMIEYPGSAKTIADVFLAGAMRRRRHRIAASASLIIVPLKQIIPAEFQEKVREIEWGADTDLFDPAALPDRESLRLEREGTNDEIRLIHVSSLRKWHGVTKLLEAFRPVPDAVKLPVKLIVIGPARMKNQKNVYFMDRMQHPELPAWLKMSDIAVLPFAPEKHPYLKLGFYWSPLKLFEAMAMELPLITLQHPRLIGLVGTDDSGFYFDGTVENLTQKMIDMVKNLTTYKEKAKQFRKRVLENYSWKQHGDKLNRWLEELRNR